MLSTTGRSIGQHIELETLTPFPLIVLKQWTLEILLALEFLHSNQIICRNLSLENVSVRSDVNISQFSLGTHSTLEFSIVLYNWGRGRRWLSYRWSPIFPTRIACFKSGWSREIKWEGILARIISSVISGPSELSLHSSIVERAHLKVSRTHLQASISIP